MASDQVGYVHGISSSLLEQSVRQDRGVVTATSRARNALDPVLTAQIDRIQRQLDGVLASRRGTDLADPPVMQIQGGSRRLSAIDLVGWSCLLVAGCAAGDPRFTAADPAGFWFGLWHGLIAPIAFVIGLFSDSVEIYERANGGGWYDFGFLLGVACFGKCGHSSQRRWRDARSDRDALPAGHGSARVKVDIDWTAKDSGSDEAAVEDDASKAPRLPGSSQP